MIVGPPIECSSNDLADWLELEVLVAERDSAPIRAVNQTLEIGEDMEPDELDEENILAERRLQQVVSAVDERRHAMGVAYPFSLDDSGTCLTLTEQIESAGYVYLFCLIVSAGAPGGLLQAGPARPDLDRARSLFQVCATVASAGFAVGPAFSTGWPRPDSTTFLEKLREVYAHFGDGQVHAVIPLGAPRQVKDDEIDVVAWRHTNDVRPPMGYFLGQAASGADWPRKSLKGHVDTFHGTWFSQQPAARPRVGTIMPFCLPSPADADAADHEAQETIEFELRRFQLEHEELLHRHRVASYLAEGLRLHEAGIGPIERIADLEQIVEYVTAYREQLRAAAATL